MKKLLCTLLAIMLLVMTAVPALSVSADSVTKENTDESFILGDADSDGSVTILDSTAIRRALVLLITETYNEKAADVDSDGTVTIIDATWIQRHLAGMSSPLDTPTNDELYARAVSDAMVAEESDIMPLVNISKDDENVIWDGDRVLVSFMHKYPDSYPNGDTITLQWGDVWCTSAEEMIRWVQTNGDGVTDWTERFHQLLGMPTTKEYNTITALWVDADLLYRPAFEPDPNKPMQTTLQKTGDAAFDDMFQKWFEKNTLSSYYTGSYPWTRLGYTYDWADNGTAYGLSEFIIFNGAEATVAYTCSVDDYVAFALAQ